MSVWKTGDPQIELAMGRKQNVLIRCHDEAAREVTSDTDEPLLLGITFDVKKQRANFIFVKSIIRFGTTV